MIGAGLPGVEAPMVSPVVAGAGAAALLVLLVLLVTVCCCIKRKRARVTTVAAGFLPDEEDKHSATWRSCDSQVYHSFFPTF